MNSPSPSKVL
jgi:hypothetical protein